MRIQFRLLGLLFLIVGAVGFALMLVGGAAASKLVSIDVLTTGPIRWALGLVGSLIAIISPVYLVVGAGLLRQATWARPLAFAVAMMSVFSFPTGTLLALVTFGVFYGSNSKSLFEAPVSSGPSPRGAGSGAGDTTSAPVLPLPPVDGTLRPSHVLHVPTPVITAAYHVELDDLVAFAEYHTAQSPAVRRTYYWSLGTGVILVLVLLWYLGFQTVGGWAGAVVALVGWVVYLKWRTQTGNRRYYRRLYGEGANRGMIGLHKASADAEGLTVTTEVMDARMRWSGVERIAEAPGLAFIYVGSLNAYVLPEARVVEGNFREFVDTIRRLHAAAPQAP